MMISIMHKDREEWSVGASQEDEREYSAILSSY